VGFENPSFGGDRIFRSISPFCIAFLSLYSPFSTGRPHGLIQFWSFGVLEGVGDVVVITVLGGFSSDGIELVHVRLRSSGRVRNARVVMCRISLPGFPGFYFLYFVEEAVEDD
jgi:hypothetical protein